MTRYIKLLLFIILLNCSFDTKSRIWTEDKRIQEVNKNITNVFKEKEIIKKEFNSNLLIKTGILKKDYKQPDNLINDLGILNFNSKIEKSSKFKFSKIENFDQYQPEISFFKNNVIFFDNKGSIIKFNDESKLIWKKNYYSKSERKLKPILHFVNNGKYLIVADNIAKFYMVDIKTGDLIWSKNSLAPFNSQIKIYNDKFFIIDFSNALRCFSLKNGKELWNVKTENSLIRSQKKLSMVIIDNVIYFNNSIGDISAVDIDKGKLLWQLPTQSNLIYESAFSLETSDIVTDKKTLFISNNKNQLFSIDVKTGSFNWENRVNSNLRSTIVDNFLFLISIEGYLIVIDKTSGNIVRVTDVFSNFKIKKRSSIKPTGFIVGTKNIYLSTSNGKLIIIDTETGKVISMVKIHNKKISKPFIQNKNLFLIKDNGIIKLN